MGNLGYCNMKFKQHWLLLLASALLPAIPLLFQYRQNALYVELSYVLYLCAEGVLLSALLYVCALLIFRSRLSAFAVCLVGCVAVFLNAQFAALQLRFYCAIAVLVMLLFALLLRKARRFEEPASVFLSIAVAAVFLMNAIPIAAGELSRTETSATASDDYVVDSALPSPNIYWIHCDTMISPDTYEALFGADTSAWLAALSERGFLVNSDASLIAGHTTMVSVPALMSPHFYDAYLAELLTSHEAAIRLTQYGYDRHPLKDAITEARISRLELREAFRRKDYALSVLSLSFAVADHCSLYADSAYISDKDTVFQTAKGMPPSTLADNFSAYLARPRVQFNEMLFGRFATLQQKLDDLLGMSQRLQYANNGIASESFVGYPIGFALPDSVRDAFSGTDWFDTFGRLLDFTALSAGSAQPTLHTIFMTLEGTHVPWAFDADGNRYPVEPSKDEIRYYPDQYERTERLLLAMIDLILAADPDAVIILQGDHGPSSYDSAYDSTVYADALGIEGADERLANSVVSAVRVPAQYRTDELSHALSDPRNIARYLVNSYVGRNYDYLS